MMVEEPKLVELTHEETQALKQRIFTDGLTDKDKDLLAGLITFNLWLREQLSRVKFSLKKLKRLLGFHTEKKTPKKPTDDVTSSDADTSLLQAQDSTDNSDNKNIESATSPPPPKKTPNWSPDANHGRYGYDDYVGLETVIIPHETVNPGDACPECLKAGQSSRLSAYDAGVYILLRGSPIVTGTRYQAKGCRCHLCGLLYKPLVPDDIKRAPKYDATAISSIAVYHYQMGLPFKRIETCQKSAGIPLADATQYDKMVTLKNEVRPILRCLFERAANSRLLSYDDTSLPVLDLAQSHATAIISDDEGHPIYLYSTSCHVAGAEVRDLLEQRTTSGELITMTDASNQNRLDVNDDLLTRLIIAYCLTHGRRRFHDLLDDFPEICGVVIEAIATVYRHEAHCRNKQLSAEERLTYHQKHSGPVMKALHVYLSNLWQYETIERNSPLGDSVRYLLKHWSALTRFLQVAGCPIDNNRCERAIKILIRYRKNSLFYRTLQGALCGDMMMSLIQTAIHNDVNPFDYLTMLQRYSEALHANPVDFLPWNYVSTLATLAQAQVA